MFIYIYNFVILVVKIDVVGCLCRIMFVEGGEYYIYSFV